MTTPQDHYDRLLAQHYTWMFGVPFQDKVAEQAALLRRAGVDEPGLAVDLGCGSGFQTMALVELGASRVHAIDTSEALLGELRTHTGTSPVTAHRGDLLAFDRMVKAPADTVVCMGDTLTHLPSPDDVTTLIGGIAAALRPGGRVVLSWRDLSRPPAGPDRFIPVRSTDDRVMMCFLENQGEYVLVHDLVHVKEVDGWRFHASAYPKLKLPPDRIRAELARAGLEPDFEETVRGMTVIAARR